MSPGRMEFMRTPLSTSSGTSTPEKVSTQIPAHFARIGTSAAEAPRIPGLVFSALPEFWNTKARFALANIELGLRGNAEGHQRSWVEPQSRRDSRSQD